MRGEPVTDSRGVRHKRDFRGQSPWPNVDMQGSYAGDRPRHEDPRDPRGTQRLRSLVARWEGPPRWAQHLGAMGSRGPITFVDHHICHAGPLHVPDLRHHGSVGGHCGGDPLGRPYGPALGHRGGVEPRGLSDREGLRGGHGASGDAAHLHGHAMIHGPERPSGPSPIRVCYTRRWGSPP